MPEHMRVPEPPAFLDLHGGSMSLESGATPAMHAAITALRNGDSHGEPPYFEDSVFALMAVRYAPVITHLERLA